MLLLVFDKFLCGYMVFNSLGYVLMGGIAGSLGISTFNFFIQELLNIFSKWLYNFKFQPAMYEGSNFLIHWPTLVIIHLFYIVFLMNVKWYLIVLLFCVSLMANNEHIFMCRLVICIYYSKNVYPDHVPILKLSFIIECTNFLYVLYIDLLLYI